MNGLKPVPIEYICYYHLSDLSNLCEIKITDLHQFNRYLITLLRTFHKKCHSSS